MREIKLMHDLDEIAERIHASFEARTAARDKILSQARTLTRHCANAIRAIHRDETTLAKEDLVQAEILVNGFQHVKIEYPDLYYAGYTQDALKEYAEASIVCALLMNLDLPSPEDLRVEFATYLQGLAEAVGELRRRCLDDLLHEHPSEAVRLLEHMDDFYAILVSMDYPDAITGGLRRLTDLARSIIERTRGDLTLSLRQEKLEQSLYRLETKLNDPE
jgi:translin